MSIHDIMQRYADEFSDKYNYLIRTDEERGGFANMWIIGTSPNKGATIIPCYNDDGPHQALSDCMNKIEEMELTRLPATMT